jgi:YfiH family protein
MLTPITAANLTSLPGIAHGFFGRRGGVSAGIYACLNCGLGSNDDRTAVTENRRRVALHLLGREAPVVTVYQVHSADALYVDAPFPAGGVPKADALVTGTKGLVIGALAADCTPVLFAEPEARLVGAAHAGWRGALGGVLESTVAAIIKAGGRQQRIRAAIGPTINQPNYEVGPEFEAKFMAQDREAQPFFKTLGPRSRPHFDLPGYVEYRLAALGLAAIERQTRCTYQDADDLFSFRRATHRGEPDYGRQISAIVLT